MTYVEKALLRVARIGVFLVPFVPLVITASMFFPFITGKNFTFRIIVEIIFACWLLLALRRPEFRPKKSLLLWGVGAFLFIVFLADVFAENPFKAFWSNFERMEGFITLAHLGAYFLVASSVLDTEKLWHRFFATSVGVSAFLGIYGILQLAGKIVINQGGVRLDGTFGNAAYFAGYMLFHVFLTLFLIARHRAPLFAKWLYGGALVLQIFALYFTATRGMFLGLVVGLMLTVCGTVIFERENRRLRLYSAIGAVVLLVGVGALFTAQDSAFVKSSPVLSRFASISLDAARTRFMVWGMAFEGFKENPVLGWGQEGFNYVFNKYYNPGMWAQEQWFDRTHNIFFDWLIAAGILGLLSYLTLFGSFLFLVWRGKEGDGTIPLSFVEKSVLTGLLAAYFIHNFVVFDNISSYILAFSLLAFAHARFAKPFPYLENSPAWVEERKLYIIGGVLLIALSASIYFFNVRGMAVARALIGGLKQYPNGAAENLSFYKEAAARETIGSQEVAEQAMQAAATVAAAENLPADLRTEFSSFAISVMEREIVRATEDARLQLFLGMFYNRLKRSGEALPYLEKAHALSPTKQTMAFELANVYLNTGKNAEALALLKKAHESAPQFESARIVYAVAAIYAKEFQIAADLLNPIIDTAVSDERVLKAYYDVKQYDKVLEIWKVRAGRDPNTPQTHVSLAAAYLINNNRAKAIEELQQATKLNPSFKEQAEYYIREIRAGRNP